MLSGLVETANRQYHLLHYKKCDKGNMPILSQKLLAQKVIYRRSEENTKRWYYITRHLISRKMNVQII